MDIANASLLDEATAAAEAMAFNRRISRSKSMKFFASEDCHPQTLDVLKTRAEPMGIELVLGTQEENLEMEFFGVLLQYPSTTGVIHDIGKWIEQWHQNDTMVSVATDLLSLVLLKPPGELGADVVIGNSQRFGVPMGSGATCSHCRMLCGLSWTRWTQIDCRKSSQDDDVVCKIVEQNRNPLQ